MHLWLYKVVLVGGIDLYALITRGLGGVSRTVARVSVLSITLQLAFAEAASK